MSKESEVLKYGIRVKERNFAKRRTFESLKSSKLFLPIQGQSDKVDHAGQMNKCVIFERRYSLCYSL